MKETGSATLSTDREKRYGRMEIVMRVHGMRIRGQVRVRSGGRTGIGMRVSGRKIKYKEWVRRLG